MVCTGLTSQNMCFVSIEYDYYASTIKIGDFVSTTTSAFEYCSKQHYFRSTDVQASVLAFKIRENYSDYDETSKYGGHYGYDFYIVSKVISTYDYGEDWRNEPLYTSCDVDEDFEIDELDFDIDEIEELESF